MTRWKREFRAWAERQELRCWTTPKRPEDWRPAKVMSLIVDAEMRKREPEIQRAFNDLIAFGRAEMRFP